MNILAKPRKNNCNWFATDRTSFRRVHMIIWPTIVPAHFLPAHYCNTSCLFICNHCPYQLLIYLIQATYVSQQNSMYHIGCMICQSYHVHCLFLHSWGGLILLGWRAKKKAKWFTFVSGKFQQLHVQIYLVWKRIYVWYIADFENV